MNFMRFLKKTIRFAARLLDTLEYVLRYALTLDLVMEHSNAVEFLSVQRFVIPIRSSE